MHPVLAAVLIGVAVGVVVGALGAGGGILSVPVLVYLLGQSPHSAAASSLVIVGATAIAGLHHHVRQRSVDWSHGLAFGLLGVAGSFAGSRLSVLVDGQVLMGLFALLLAAVSVAMFIKAAADWRVERAGDREPTDQRAGDQGREDHKPGDHEPSAPSGAAEPASGTPDHQRSRFGRWLRLIVLATLTGMLTGFFGVGGGFIVVPVLVLVMGLPIRTAAGTSLLVMVIATASGLASRVGTHVEIDWPLTLAFAAASMIGGLIGGPVTTRVKTSVLTLAFAALLGTVAVVIAIQVVSGL